MTIKSAVAGIQASLGFFPSFMFVDTDNTFVEIQEIGFLNGLTWQPTYNLIATPVPQSGQLAVVTTSDKGTVTMQIDIDDSGNVNLILPASLV